MSMNQFYGFMEMRLKALIGLPHLFFSCSFFLFNIDIDFFYFYLILESCVKYPPFFFFLPTYPIIRPIDNCFNSSVTFCFLPLWFSHRGAPDPT